MEKETNLFDLFLMAWRGVKRVCRCLWQFVKDIVDSVIMRNVDIKPTVAADKLYRIGNYPRKKELEYASNIAFILL